MNFRYDRRSFIQKSGNLVLGTVLLSNFGFVKGIIEMMDRHDNQAILKVKSLNTPWETQDPFIFCAYHYDKYPGGKENLGPKSALHGRNIGQDFSGKDGWSMYHGEEVPGFPAHPHSGFETVTIVKKGMVDHSDSLGATGRFGNGDVQWLTSGKGVQHAEMFPLLDEHANPFELFQIWLNLPAKSKKVDPYYKMLWKEEIPILVLKDKEDKVTTLNLIAGDIHDRKALSPTPNSWAADPNNKVQIWTFKMEANASYKIPSSEKGLTRTLYFYDGETIKVEETKIESKHLIELDSSKAVIIKNGSKEAYFLFLQGRPINEPVVQYGPFVANSKAALHETMAKYRKTEFGGWPWPNTGPVNVKSKGRFSKLPDGTEILK